MMRYLLGTEVESSVTNASWSTSTTHDATEYAQQSWTKASATTGNSLNLSLLLQIKFK